MSKRTVRTFATWRLCARLLFALLATLVSAAPFGRTVAVADDAKPGAEAPAAAKGDVDDAAKRPAPTAHDYFPMSLGDRWVYKKTVAYEGEQPAVTETYSLVRGEYLFNGELWRHFEEDAVCFWVHIRDDGQYEADVGYDEETLGLQIDREFQVFRYPAKPGDEWPYLADLTGESPPGTVRCLAVDEEAVTPAGKFRCLVYELDETETKAVYRFAPGLGLVSCTWKSKERGGETITLELKRFLPGKFRSRSPAAKPVAKE
ncbi:MAG: hypothetical protein KF688_12755 [Pirellulales bacterium]|nr:hypothetical protein [Pirellulales bacterium]